MRIASELIAVEILSMEEYPFRTQMEGVAVPQFQQQEPPGWRELCAKLQAEKDPTKFQALVDEINRLLSAYEKESLSSASRLVNVRSRRRSAEGHPSTTG